MARDKDRSRRFGEPAKFLPVIFVIGLIATIYGIYTYVCDLLTPFCNFQAHLFRLLQVTTPESQRDKAVFNQGVTETIVFNILAFMMLVNLVLSIVTAPGTIPNTPEWEYVENDGRQQPVELQTALETKKTGDRRFCKWRCAKYKPDRTHHCRVCDSCVLRMDHHCPWIYNCVGFRNHKYFFLLLLYSTVVALFASITMVWSVENVLMQDDPAMSELFLVLFGETLTVFMAIILSGFFAFHVFLGFKGLTTIEFCEKQKSSNYDSVFSRGVFANFQDILGKNVLIWLLPIPPQNGDGLSFEVDLAKFQDANQSVDKGKLSRSNSPPMRGDDGGTGGGDEKTALLQA